MMMPLKSKAQERYLWANDPQLAKKYEEETGAQARGMVVQCNAGVGLSGGPSLDAWDRWCLLPHCLKVPMRPMSTFSEAVGGLW